MSGRGKKATLPAWITSQSSDNNNNNDSSNKTSNESNVIKTESNGNNANNNNNTAGDNNSQQISGRKPRFVPKIPMKKESTAKIEEKSNVIANPPINNETKDRQHSQNIKSRHDRNKRHGNNRNNNNDNKSSRRWVMPTGTAFFTGIAGSHHASTHSRVINSSNNNGVINTTNNSTVSRPNEHIGEVAFIKVKKEEEELNKSNIVYQNNESNIQSEYDSDDGFDEADYFDRIDEETGAISTPCLNEIWPPKDYNPVAPVSLPIGPRSHAKRSVLTNQDLFAPADDLDLLQLEESSSLYLIQLPSTLKFENTLPINSPYCNRNNSNNNAETNSAIDLTGDNTNNTTESKYHNKETQKTHIGKIQIMRSGKVQLVTNDNLTYSLNPGVAASFVQVLTSIDTVSNNNSESKLSKESKGSMYLMGSVTKKMVVTPNFDIGVQRPRSYSSTEVGTSSETDVLSSSEAIDKIKSPYRRGINIVRFSDT